MHADLCAFNRLAAPGSAPDAVHCTGLVAVALAIELLGGSNVAYNYMLVGIFTTLTVTMIAICGWTVFLWDIDRLFFKLENKIDAEVGELGNIGIASDQSRTSRSLNVQKAA